MSVSSRPALAEALLRAAGASSPARSRTARARRSSRRRTRRSRARSPRNSRSIGSSTAARQTRAGVPTSAASRSAIRSSTASIPTESRIRFRGRGERRVGGRGVRHPGRVLDQALDAAERLGEQEELRPRRERDRLLLGLDEERDHAAEVAHLPARDLVAGMAGQAGVEHALDRRRARRGTPAIARGVLAVLAHPERERLQPAQDEPAVERARAPRRATSAGSGAARRAPASFVRDDAADHVGVAAEVLRRRVDDEVGAERERLLEVRRGEGVVDDEQRAGGVGGVGGAADVDDVQQRVRRRLDPDEARVVAEVRRRGSRRTRRPGRR